MPPLYLAPAGVHREIIKSGLCTARARLFASVHATNRHPDSTFSTTALGLLSDTYRAYWPTHLRVHISSVIGEGKRHMHVLQLVRQTCWCCIKGPRLAEARFDGVRSTVPSRYCYHSKGPG